MLIVTQSPIYPPGVFILLDVQDLRGAGRGAAVEMVVIVDRKAVQIMERGGKKTCKYYNACGCAENCIRCEGYQKKEENRKGASYDTAKRIRRTEK